jgi:NADPH:quinone reductase-like Zn-dependent oxidoreductase
MRAVFIKQHGGPEVLEVGEFNDPIINDNEVLVRIKYTSVNRIDILVRRGYPGIPVKLPHILGTDVVGYVEKVGAYVNNLSPGDLVIANPVIGCGYCKMCSKGLENMCHDWKMIGFQINGSYAEYQKIPARSLIKFNSNIDIKELGSVPLALLVSWRALVTLGRIKRDETVFIWAGSSGVGTFSIQIAKFFGAKVITTSGKKWKVEKLKSMNVDLVIDYNSDNLIEKVKEFTNGDGVDLVIDPVGSVLTRSLDLELIKIGGKIIVFGVKDSDNVPVNWRKIYLKHVKIIGTHTGNKWELMEALELIRKRFVRPVIYKTFNLDEIADAHRLLESGESFGKIVIKVD